MKYLSLNWQTRFKINKQTIPYRMTRMLTRQECIKSIELNLHQANSVSLRNTGRSLADYCRVILNEIASHRSGYGKIKKISIKMRYDLLSSLVPELETYKQLFIDVQKIRDIIEHDDDFTPSIVTLQDLTLKVKILDSDFESKIIPRLAKLGEIPEKYLDELEDVLEIFYNIEANPDWATGNLDVIHTKIEEFESIASRLKNLDTDLIQEARLELRDLKNHLRTKLKEAQDEVQFAILDHEFDMARGK